MPDRRWGPEQIDEWLEGKDVALPIFEEDFSYKFAPHEEARSPAELARFIGEIPTGHGANSPLAPYFRA